MNRQMFYLLTLVVIFLEFIQLSNTRRLIKIRKFYRPNKPWRHKERQYLPPYIPKNMYKKKSQWKPRYHPQRHRPIHSSHFTTVEIEFPKDNENIGKWKNQNLMTNCKLHDYIPELIDEDFNELIQRNNQKLRIHISRNDNLDNDQGSVINVSSDINPASTSERRITTVDYTKPVQFNLFHNFEGG